MILARGPQQGGRTGTRVIADELQQPARAAAYAMWSGVSQQLARSARKSAGSRTFGLRGQARAHEHKLRCKAACLRAANACAAQQKLVGGAHVHGQGACLIMWCDGRTR